MAEDVIPPRHQALQEAAVKAIVAAFPMQFVAACRGIATGMPEAEVVALLQDGKVDELIAAR
jgi:hypothetical protein